MSNRVLRPITDRLGARGLMIVLLAPLIAGLLTILVTPRLMKPNSEAEATFNIQPVIGTYASFEVTTHVADFLNALKGSATADSAAQASGLNAIDAASALTATSEGGFSGASVTFTAPTPEAAAQGLQAAARTSLQQIASNDLVRAQLVFASATASMAALVQAFDGATFEQGEMRLDAQDRRTARDQALLKAAERVETSQADLLAAQASVRAVETVLRSTPISTRELSTQQDEIRVMVTSQVLAFILALSLVLLARRRAGRAATAAEDAPGPPDSSDLIR